MNKISENLYFLIQNILINKYRFKRQIKIYRCLKHSIKIMKKILYKTLINIFKLDQ